jgi:hypothetical protein
LPELTVTNTLVQHVRAASRKQPRLGPARTQRKDFPLDKNLVWREMQQQVRHSYHCIPHLPTSLLDRRSDLPKSYLYRS